jgi:hypothetical protein
MAHYPRGTTQRPNFLPYKKRKEGELQKREQEKWTQINQDQVGQFVSNQGATVGIFISSIHIILIPRLKIGIIVGLVLLVELPFLTKGFLKD